MTVESRDELGERRGWRGFDAKWKASRRGKTKRNEEIFADTFRSKKK